MVDLDAEIYSLLNKQIRINELRYLSSGDDSDTFLCNEQYVVKVPKRDSARNAQKREFELYRFLEGCNLSYQTPAVVYQSDRANIMTYLKGEHITYEQYHKLREKEKDALAFDEATFLKELHSIEIDCSVSLFSDALVNKKDKFLQDKKLLEEYKEEINELKSLMVPLREDEKESVERKSNDIDKIKEEPEKKNKKWWHFGRNVK